MARIETYVFFDLETTGLPQEEEYKTRITELSMLALKRRHLVQSATGQLPRVVSKLTMCLNPDREVSAVAAVLSELNNDLLSDETIFNEDVFNVINTFLKLQVKPVCLIAHYGHKFDVPILKNHFDKLNVSLPDDIMFADSYDCFKDLSKRMNTETNVDEANSQCESSSYVILGSGSAQDNKSFSFLFNKRRRRSNDMVIKPAKKKAQVRRNIFYDDDGRRLTSFKLVNIYKRVLGRDAVGSHRAENDSVMIAEIATAMAENFKEWIDNNHIKFP